MAVRNTASGWLVIGLSCTAIAWRCAPRVDIAEGDAGAAGESGQVSVSGATFGGSSGGTSTSSGGARPSSGGSSPSSGGTSPSSGGTSPSSGGTSPSSGGAPPSFGGTDDGGSGAPSWGDAGQSSAGASGAARVCRPGADQTCNDDLNASALWGHCEADGTCSCRPGFKVNSATGKCMPLARTCALPPDPGACLDTGIPHYYFDTLSGTCEPFTVYCGGEPRNANAFRTREECEGTCVVPACEVPFVDGPCDAAIPIFSYNAGTGECEPGTWGGCGGTRNRFSSADDCQAACVWKGGSSTPAVTIQGDDCLGFGENITRPGDEGMFELEGTSLSRTLFWGCGCATRPEFVMMYSQRGTSEPVQLRLCHDDGADPCEAGCSEELSWDLSKAFEEAGTTEFVFAD